MADRAFTLLLLTLTAQVSLNFAALYKGCYKENLRDRHFKLSPGNYNPNTLVVEKCTELCGLFEETYAGLISGQFCFCGNVEPDIPTYQVADSFCDMPCAGNASQTCGGGMYLNIYQSAIPISKVELTASPVVVQTGDTVTFSLVVESGAFMTYEMDYGDGNGNMAKNATGMLSKSYSMPGQYDAVVTASDVGNTVMPKSDNAGVYVQAPVNGLKVECPLFITDDENFCVATITEGSRVVLYDELDGTTKTIDVADPVVDAAGCCVPSTSDTAIADALPHGVFMMPASEFKYEGVITRWELWADTGSGTDISVMVLKPTCGTYCYETNSCTACTGTTCVAGDAFCPRATTCTSGCPAADRHAAVTVSYDVREAVTLTVTPGYQVIEAADYIQVFPGDILAYEKTATSARITVSTGQTHADIRFAASTSNFPSGSGTPEPGVRHHIRAIYSSQTKVHLSYLFTDPGTFPLVTNASNLDLPYYELNSTEVEVLQGINATVIETDTFWVTGEAKNFTILPYTGTNVLFNWLLGDSFQDNDTLLDVYTYTYSTRGEYTVYVNAHNALTNKDNTTTIYVEDRITGFALNPINCVTLQNCPFTITLTSGSDHVITWDYGDGNTETTVEADSGNGGVINHVYNLGGTYTVTANCSNNVSSEVVTLTVLVQEECLGLALVRTGAEKNVDFKIEWTLTQGTNCAFHLVFDGAVVPVASADDVAKIWGTALLPGRVANAYPLVLNVTNAVSTDELSVNFIIETAMRNVQTSCSLATTGTGIPTTCEATMDEGSNVICTWDFDDGTAPVVHDNGPADWALLTAPVTQTHTFTQGKLHNVTITCANNDRTETQNHEILVIASVVDVELHHKPTIFFAPPGIGEFTFNTTGPAPNEATVEFNFGDGITTSEDLVMDIVYRHNYRDPSDFPTTCYPIEARIFNQVSDKAFTGTEMCVIDPIINMRIYTDPPGAVKNVPVPANVVMYRGPSGSFCELDCDFGDGAGNVVFDRTGSGQDGVDTKMVTYTTLGSKTITCTATTPLETMTESYTLVVDEPVTNDCTISTNFPVTHGSNIEYSVVCNTNPMPTNAFFTVDPGDGSPPIVVPFTGTAGTPLTITHTPATDGHYVAQLTLANAGSSISDSLFAGSYIPLTTASYSCSYKPEIPVNSPLVAGINGLNKDFPLSSPITCEITVAAGTPVYYLLTATHVDGSPVIVCNKTESPVSCSMTQAGEYSVEAQVVNPLGPSSQPVDTLNLLTPVRDFRVREVNPSVGPGEDKIFEFDFDTLGDESCLNMDFNDGTGRTFTYGDATYCATMFSTATYMGALSNPKIVTFQYSAVGNYEINATLVNYFSESFKTFKHSVSNLDCSRPDVAITDAAIDFRSPVLSEKSGDTVLRGESNISCSVTLNNVKTWVVESIDANLGTSSGIMPLSSDKAELVIKAKTLDYGLYKATYTVRMIMPDSTSFEESASTYFEITKSKLIVIIEINGISEVDRGENDVVTFDPSLYSVDPDVPEGDSQAFDSFSWQCDILVSQYGSTGCDAINGSTATILTFNTATFAVNDTFKLTCTGYKDTREGIGEIVVNVKAGNLLDLYIGPTGESLTVQVSDGWKVFSEERLALEVKCRGCDVSTLTCQWTAYSYEFRWPWRRYFEWEVIPHLTGMDSPIISIASTLYNIHPNVTRYRFSVNCMALNGDEGQAAVNIYLNRPPSGGICTVFPLVGTLSWGGQGAFNVKCTGWSDPEGIAFYKFYSKFRQNELPQQVQTFYDATDVYVNPPVGSDYDNFQEDFWVAITDNEGSTVDVLISPITVYAPTINQIGQWTDLENTIFNSENVDKVAASGSQREVTEGITQIATLLNHKRKNDEIAYQGSFPNPPLENTGFKPAIDTIVEDGANATHARINKEQEAEKIKQFEAARDNSARLRSQLAITCSEMTASDAVAMEQVLTCLQTVADAPNECTNDCQLATLNKAATIVDDLVNLKAPASVIRAVGMQAFSAVMDTSVANDVNKNHPTNTDTKNAKESTKYAEYDTSYESSDPSLIDAADPYAQHAKNVHKEIMEEQAAKNAAIVKRVTDVVTEKIVKGLTPNEAFNFSTGPVVGSFQHLSQDDILGGSVNMPMTNSKVDFPASDFLSSQLGPGESAVISTFAMKKDIHGYSPNADSLGPNTQFVTANILKSDGSPLSIQNTPDPITITIQQDSSNLTYDESEIFLAPWNKFYYKTLEVKGIDPSMHVDVSGLDPAYQLLLVVRKGSSQDIEDGKCDDIAVLPNSTTGPQNTMYTLDNIKMDKYNGMVTLAFRILPLGFDSTTLASCTDLEDFDFTTTSANLSLSLFTFLSGCYWWDSGIDDWSSVGCWVGPGTNLGQTECLCTHLTTFGGGWAVAPNTIDWNFVFSNADFFSNPTLYITEIVIACIYLIAVIWARHKDRKDLERLGLTPLKDNEPKDKYYYEVVVTTGMRRNAGTDSKVFLILSGEYDETDVRLLNDDKRKVFRRGNTDAFLMAVPEPLGALNYARVWHDNTGKGKFGSWYMKYIIVRDVQTEQKWIFICNRWFAVEEDDGQVDRVVPVAGLAQMTEFGHLFSQRSRKNLVDGHLWFSVVARPPQSRFTRVQRVSCCLCLLFATMLANAMFYGLADDEAGTALQFGPFALSPQQIYVGLISNLIVFPANFIIIYLFRKSKARKMRPSRLEEALKKMPGATSASTTDVKPEVAGIWTSGGSRGESRAGSSMSYGRPDSRGGQRVEKKKKKKKFELPWFCRILGWILLWAVTLTAAAFVTFYGIMFQDEKCKKWITSLLISFFTSIFITQPVKVFLTAIFFSLIWRKAEEEDDDKVEDEEEPNLGTDEEFLHSPEGFGAARPRKIGYKPPDPEALEKARIKRLNEIKMWDIIRELIFYSFFLWILMVISYRNRSPHGFYYKSALENMVINSNDSSFTEHHFSKIKNTEDFWKWARSGMVNSVRASSYYNNEPPLLLRGFVGDKVSRIMGYATMRQLRVKPALCEPIPVISVAIPECNEAYSLFSESKDEFAPGWQPLGINETARMEYYYRTPSDLNGYPYIGKLEVYGGGGYVQELRGSKGDLTNKMIQLQNETWIDKYTRAIFVEFTVYNPQVNLFAIATILAEFQPSGGVLTSYRFEPAMLLPYMTEVMLFQIACEVIYFIFTIVFIVKAFRTMIKEKGAYFKSFWNLVELSIIAMSLGSIIVYFYRLIITAQLTARFEKTHGNEYMKFQYAGYWNEIFSYMIGWLVFFGTLKFLKLLRFNKRMSLLASTLKNGARSIIHFSLMFAILYLAFMQLFYLTYKNVSSAFTTFIMAAESGLLMMMGKFDIYGMLMVEPVLTQIYVFSFVVTITFILVNMFLSILNETFSSVRVDINKQNNDYEIVDFMVNRFKRWTGIGAGQKEENADPNAANKNPQAQPTVEEFPDRIDRLLNSISNVYMDDNINAFIESKGESKKMAMKHMLRRPNSGGSRVGPARLNTR